MAIFNGSGDSDILVLNTSGVVVDWTMDGSTITATQGLTYQGNNAVVPSNWSIVGIGDFSGDGNSDILLLNKNGVLVDWTMDGSTITSVQGLTYQGIAATLPSGWSIAGVGDYDGSGKSDILLLNPSNGTLMDWTMDGSIVTAMNDLTYQGNATSVPAGWSIEENPTTQGPPNSPPVSGSLATTANTTMAPPPASSATLLQPSGGIAALSLGGLMGG